MVRQMGEGRLKKFKTQSRGADGLGLYIKKLGKISTTQNIHMKFQWLNFLWLVAVELPTCVIGEHLKIYLLSNLETLYNVSTKW